MTKLTRQPTESSQIDYPARYERFSLQENPFPPEPTINKDSQDRRINGDIYENEIRKLEFEQIQKSFLRQSLSMPNHLRLGYIVDTSYIGRGNGKSAFLVNLQNKINNDFCLDISGGINKSFAIYVQPEPGGRTKSFMSFLDALFSAIIRADMVNIVLASLRLTAINTLYPAKKFQLTDEELVQNLLSENWFEKEGLDLRKLEELICQNKTLQDLPSDFPIFRGRRSLIVPFISQRDFELYYSTELKKGKDKIDFIFTHLVRLFQSASFNGAFILVDDFERIPDWQSARQKKDFALELRTALFDGMSLNAKLGFYNFILVLHAGVQGLIINAWAESGMENRSPISPSTTSNHLIRFEKLNREHAILMVKKYLSEYRLAGSKVDPLYPFTGDAIEQIGELSEYNAAKILKMAYDLVELVVTSSDAKQIDREFVLSKKALLEETANKNVHRLENVEGIDLQKKISE